MKKLVTFVVSILIGVTSYSQVQCGANMDFEMGNLSGWSGSTGHCIQVNCNTFVGTPGLVPIQWWSPFFTVHALNSSGFDVYSCYNVPKRCPWGGQYSLQLGNEGINYETEDIQYTYTVSAANPIIVYAFAPILEDPAHVDSLQPAFKAYIKDSSGNIVPCSYYKVNATNMRGYSRCLNRWNCWVWYYGWQNVAIDMSAYAGQRVTIYFQTNDCGLGAHAGYAYIDVIGCYPKEISISPCPSSTSVTLTAPPGFRSYVWSTGERTQSITINPTNISSVSVTVTSFQGCPIVLTANNFPLGVNANFSGTNVCLCDNIANVFTDLTTALPGDPIIRWEWDFGDGTALSYSQNTSHRYLLPGTYTVSLIVRTASGCNYGITKQVRVYPCPSISMISHN